jgi:hypothetical protein
LTVTVRNNFPEIRNYVLEAQGEGLQFFPPRSEISIGASMERDIDVRVFANDKTAGLRPWRLRLSGSAEVDLPLRFLVIPRNEAVAYSLTSMAMARRNGFWRITGCAPCLPRRMAALAGICLERFCAQRASRGWRDGGTWSQVEITRRRPITAKLGW